MSDKRHIPFSMDKEEFKREGYKLVDQLADLFEGIREEPVTQGSTAEECWNQLGTGSLPEKGAPASEVLDEASRLLLNNSLYNGHPKFWGYITAGGTPIGVLGDLLASGVNPNVGGWVLSPMATTIEKQTVDWIADLIGYPIGDGILVSGGNMANFVGFLCARRKILGEDVREKGLGNRKLISYCAKSTHTWIQKAADLFGFGTDTIRWIPVDENESMIFEELVSQVEDDRTNGLEPFFVVGTAGAVSTGGVDPISRMADYCEENDLWLHIDGAYGAPAACLPDAPPDIKAIRRADSVALDPHKWLYAPLEAGCTLVKDPKHLLDAFSYVPEYYHLGEELDYPAPNYYAKGFQNSRGFRALKVWLALKQAGREGYVQSIGDDISLTREMAKALDAHPDIKVMSCRLSIVTFQYRPQGLEDEEKINQLNQTLMDRMQKEGEAFVSNAIIGEHYCMRACIVTFRTQLEDVLALPALLEKLGKDCLAELS